MKVNCFLVSEQKYPELAINESKTFKGSPQIAPIYTNERRNIFCDNPGNLWQKCFPFGFDLSTLCFCSLIFFITANKNSLAEIENDSVKSFTTKPYATMNALLNVPLGRYAASDNKNSGYAKIGSQVHLEAVWMMNTYLGLGLKLALVFNSTNYNEYFKDIPSYYEVDNNYDMEQFTGWSHKCILPGIFWSIQHNNLSFDLNLCYGYNFTKLPAISISYIDSSDNKIEYFGLNQKFNNLIGNAGCGLKIFLPENGIITISVNYLTSNMDYNFNIDKEIEGNYHSTIITHHRIPLKTISIGAGFGTRF